MASAEASESTRAGMHAVPSSLFEERETPNTGIGVFAITTIPSGTRILCEPPLFALPDDMEDVIACYQTIKALPPDKEASFWALAASTLPPADPDWIAELRASFDDDVSTSFDELVQSHEDAYARFETNRFTLRSSDGSPNRLGVFPNAARFNHSCSPNIYHRYNSNIDRLTMHAIRDIKPGEEICTAYIDICHDTTERRRILRHWGFKCNCITCKTHDSAQDWRRRKLEDLMSRMHKRENKRAMQNWSTWDYAEALTTVEEIIVLMVEDGLEETDTLGEAYANAAEYCLAVGWNEEAVKWAEKGLAVELKCCGEDSPEYEKAAILLESACAA